LKYSANEEHRKFKAWTGVTPTVAESIFQKYFNPIGLPDRSRVLIVLQFLKSMSTEDEGAAEFKLSRKTYRKYLWSAIEYLNESMNEIDISRRYSSLVPKTGVFANVSLIVDSTDCPIDRPSKLEDRLEYTSGRSKENTYGRYNLKYTVGCQITTGEICLLLGPEPGRISDIVALRNGAVEMKDLQPKEILLADKGYQGHYKCLSPFKGTSITPTEEAFNEVLASVRILLECVFQRMKIFGVLGRKGIFRHTISKHKLVFNLVCQVTIFP
jgi:hypothetical protein